jgi:predicted Zn-dependent protease
VQKLHIKDIITYRVWGGVDSCEGLDELFGIRGGYCVEGGRVQTVRG